MSSNKLLRVELKSQANKLFKAVMQNLHQRTINKYANDIKTTEHISSLKKIVRQLTLLNEAKKITSKEVVLSQSSLKKIRSDKRNVETHLATITDFQSSRQTHFKEALGGVFKETKLKADEIPEADINQIDILKSPNVVSKLLAKKLYTELTNTRTALINKKV